MNTLNWRHSSSFFRSPFRQHLPLQYRKIKMAQIQTNNLLSAAYLFHRENAEIDIDSLKHHDPIFALKWTNTQKSANSDSTSASKSNELASWNNNTFQSSLCTKWLGRTFVFSDCMESTQNFTKQNALALPVGTVTVANTQTSARGRANNKWSSPPGCLVYSFITNLSYKRIKCLATMQYVISIAIVDAVLELTQNRVQLQLKWPNDLYYNNLKIGGVLCESRYDAERKQYVITSGIGLNVDNEEPTICINDIIRKLNEDTMDNGDGDEKEKEDQLRTVSREEILGGFINHFERIYEALQQEGFGVMKGKYLKYWMHSGQKVTVDQDAQGMKAQKGSSADKIEMFIIGVSDDGQLLGQNVNGDTFELHPDGNSFDFLHGLVCRKRT